ncbi:MAG: endo-1,4-beta-xylanase [Actinomycetota bacterium]
MSVLPALVAGVGLAAASAVAGALDAIEVEPLAGAVRHTERTEPLHALADAHDVSVGVAIGTSSIDEIEERVLLAHHFDIVTLENELKWEVVHPAPGEFDFSRSDELIDFAETHGMAVRGHTLVWHRQLPTWLDDRPMTAQQASALLERHITEVVGHHAGRIDQWDVVNEPFADDGSGLRPSVWLDTIGPEYVAMAFEHAHAADPGARLFLNDYDGWNGAKYVQLVDLAADLLADGVPVHGAGFQLHLAGSLDVEMIVEQVRRAERLGLEVAFTEVDDRSPAPMTDTIRRAQADRIGALARTCAASPACRSFVVWGLSDGHSWIPEHFPGEVPGTLFDAELAPTPAFHAVAAAFTSPSHTGRS